MEMESCRTPAKCNKTSCESINVPPSPFLQKLGYGTGVAVYKLERSPLLDKVRSPWAVKRTTKTKSNGKEINRRLVKEADVLRKLNHPNIVGFRAFTKDVKGKNCLLLEECNTSLGDLISDRFEEDGGPFPSGTVLKIAIDVAKAMSYLHDEVHILHCDIKSYNVLVKGDFEICKLCDFGVTMALDKDGYYVGDDDADYSGTFCWTAPEVLNDRIISTKADVYSYGLVLWETLALIPPPEPVYDEHADTYVQHRPELPLKDFDDSYNYVLELFHCCTDQEVAKRPKASDLVVIVTAMIQNQKDK